MTEWPPEASGGRSRVSQRDFEACAKVGSLAL